MDEAVVVFKILFARPDVSPGRNLFSAVGNKWKRDKRRAVTPGTYGSDVCIFPDRASRVRRRRIYVSPCVVSRTRARIFHFDINRAVESNAAFGENAVRLIIFVALQVDIERGVLAHGHVAVARTDVVRLHVNCVNRTVIFCHFAVNFYGDGATFVKRQIAVVFRTAFAFH